LTLGNDSNLIEINLTKLHERVDNHDHKHITGPAKTSLQDCTTQGWVLHKDNSYKFTKLEEYIYEECGWTIVGTILSIGKNSCKNEDILFLNISNGAQLGVKCG